MRNALKTLELPEKGSVWIGPYEQLHGAGYALLAADQHGVYERDFHNYHEKVRAKIVRLILEHPDTAAISDKSAFDNAVAGFYFNAAIQRIVWASERLIKTFVAIPCICKRPAEKNADSRNFGRLLQDSKLRMKHLISADKTNLPDTTAMLNQFPTHEYNHESAFDSNFTLSMLRHDVNNRKHAVYGPLAQDRKSARPGSNTQPETWSGAPQDCQMHLACRAFEVVCRAYNELRGWHPIVQA